MPRWHFIAVLAIALTVLPIAAQAAETESVGNARVVVRTVLGTLQAEPRVVKFADDVYHNELIETEDGSAIEIVFLDETKLALGPNSSLTLDRFVFDPEPDQSSFVATTTKGVFRFVAGNLPKKAYTVRTPTATIGIRGTTFVLTVELVESVVDQAKSIVSIKLEEGAADLTTCGNQQVSIEGAGQGLMILGDLSGGCSYERFEF